MLDFMAINGFLLLNILRELNLMIIKMVIDRPIQFIGDICGIDFYFQFFRNDITMFFKLKSQELGNFILT